MSFALALPVAVSAIQALIKFRGRLDTILSINQATDALPFSLPEAPTDHAAHVEPMVAFFRRDVGQNILTIRGLTSEWEAVSPDCYANHVQRELTTLLNAYYEASDIVPKRLGPQNENDRYRAAKGPSKEMRLAYYIVESDRLSRNPAVTRILLAAADTLLELGTSNAGLFISNPQTRAVLESLLTEFAVKRDWDDENGGHVFRLLLGSAALAALENRAALPDKPVLHVLFDALAELQKSESTDFVAELVTRDGFQSLISSCLVRAADEPALLPQQPLLRESLVAMLRTAGNNLDGILSEPRALSGVLEAGIGAAATAATPLIDHKISQQPLLAAVLKSVLDQTQRAAGKNQLFGQLTDGRVFASLYKVALRSVAADPAALAKQTGLDAHVAKLISGLASELGTSSVQQTFSTTTLRALTMRGLDALSAHPELLGTHGEFATKLLGAALVSTAAAAKNGFTPADLSEITGAIVSMAAGNVGLIRLDDRLRPVVSALSLPLADTGLAGLTSTAGRKAMFFAGLNVLTTNPRIWGRFAEHDLAEPIVTAVIHALGRDPGGLLAGPALVPVFQRSLEAAARRGRVLIDRKTTPAALDAVLTAALQAGEDAVGDSMDARTLPQFIEAVVLSFLATPFDVKVQAALDKWMNEQLLAIA